MAGEQDRRGETSSEAGATQPAPRRDRLGDRVADAEFHHQEMADTSRGPRRVLHRTLEYGFAVLGEIFH